MSKAIAVVFGALAVVYIALRPSPSRGPLPKDVPGLAARVAAHPADWFAASALTERALDAPVRDRMALWHASNEQATSLAPLRPEPRTAFARSGFFHWQELSDADRKAVLDAYAPVMRDQGTFARMIHVIYPLTGDLHYLRRAAPRTAGATRMLAQFAAINGRFDDYRILRAEANRQEPERRTPPPHGKEAWSGPCAEDVCYSAWREIDATAAVTITVKTILGDDVRAYVEVYVDGALRAEGAIDGEQTLNAAVAGPGAHAVEVRLANPITRNGTQRRVRITALQIL